MTAPIGRAALPYRLGLPAWAFPGWKDRYWTGAPSPLACYARVFNAVEGNTTFYRVPDRSAVARWQRALEGRDFRLCFKLPRGVTHERRPATDELDAFLRAIAPLEAHLGPLLVQFPAAVGPDRLASLAPILDRVAGERRFVVELRHPAFFSQPDLAHALLDPYRCGRVMLDTRALHGGDPSHPDVAAARHEKPALPLLDTVHHGIAFVRLVLHPDPAQDAAVLAEWADRAARYLTAGYALFMMIHCPNNLHCPAFAERFHGLLRHRLPGLPALPPWPLPQQPPLF